MQGLRQEAHVYSSATQKAGLRQEAHVYSSATQKAGLRQEAHVTVSGVARSYGHRTGLYARLSCLSEERATVPVDLLRYPSAHWLQYH